MMSRGCHGIRHLSKMPLPCVSHVLNQPCQRCLEPVPPRRGAQSELRGQLHCQIGNLATRDGRERCASDVARHASDLLRCGSNLRGRVSDPPRLSVKTALTVSEVQRCSSMPDRCSSKADTCSSKPDTCSSGLDTCSSEADTWASEPVQKSVRLAPGEI